MNKETETAVLERVVTPVAPTANDKIVCKIDGALVHSVQAHINANHKGEWTIERYKTEFPGEPVLSAYAMALLESRRKESAAAAPAVPVRPAATTTMNYAMTSNMRTERKPMYEVFGLGENTAGVKNSTGNAIAVQTMLGHSDLDLTYLPDVDTGYVFSIDLLKQVIAGIELNERIYAFGYHGTGKTTLFEQVAARTARPFIRVQHTANMQESDVLGQWTVMNGSTQFQLGPLPTAMMNGWLYCADEYDVAMPNVIAVYQSVLEGKALIIKDAPPELRRIEPHPQFRIVATGNTNGSGDQTGLYQGTQIQNAANYSRFGVTIEVGYMPKPLEKAMLMAKTGVDATIADKFVDVANKVRHEFAGGALSMTISPRELLSAAKMALAFGGAWQLGLDLSFCNRLIPTDKKVVQELAQRIFA